MTTIDPLSIKRALATGLAQAGHADTSAVDMLPEPGRDPATLPIEDLVRAVGALRAQRDIRPLTPLESVTLTEQPRVAPVTLATRRTTSREQQWCKVAEDGFTPLRKKPSMKAVTVYDTATAVPSRRTWWFLDQFRRDDVVTEIHDITFPCDHLQRLARDLTLAWQLYSTANVSTLDQQLLANTPLHCEVDGIRPSRYIDLWGQLRRARGGSIPMSTRWRVVNGRITSS